MKEYIQRQIEHDGTLTIVLNDPKMIDPYLIEPIHHDTYCLDCTRNGERLEYRYDELVPLAHFLDQYIFQGEEGYAFLKDLLEKAIQVNRNKPVLLDPASIYVSRNGKEIYFVVLPLQLDYWMYRKEQTKTWIKELAERFQTRDAFELSGYLYQSLRFQEFSLPNVILGLESIQTKYYPKKWYRFKKKEYVFETQEEVAPYLVETLPKKKEDYILDPEPTQILAHDLPMQSAAYLQDETDRYDLLFEQMLVGRAMSCEIRLSDPSVSLKHAKITQNNERYYIQDLRSANGTYLNEKRVQRKMRLKEGMKIMIGNQQLVFHETL